MKPQDAGRQPEFDPSTFPLTSGDHEKFAPTGLPNIQCAGLTDIGQRRETNQDQFLIANLQKHMQVLASSKPKQGQHLYGQTMGKLLLVADGMGGNQSGDVASELAVHTLAEHLLNSMHWLFHPQEPEVEQFARDLKAAALRSHEKVRSQAERDPYQRGMGTTLTAAYLMWPLLYVLHVGDSRCYLLRDDSIQLLTKDQTLAQHLYDCGQITGSELSESPYHHVLLNAIGIDHEPEAIVYRKVLLPGDRIFLCSDGVNAHLNDEEIKEIIRSGSSASDVCQRVVDAANARGGNDNITCILATTNQEKTIPQAC